MTESVVYMGSSDFDKSPAANCITVCQKTLRSFVIFAFNIIIAKRKCRAKGWGVSFEQITFVSD